jgi:hypothetical protein
VVASLEELGKGLGIATLGYDETNGATISAAEARRMACNATIIPWVLGGDGGSSTLAVDPVHPSPHPAISLLAGTFSHSGEGSPRSGGWGSAAYVGNSSDQWGNRDRAGNEPDPIEARARL